jgi:hypothetical protein
MRPWIIGLRFGREDAVALGLGVMVGGTVNALGPGLGSPHAARSNATPTNTNAQHFPRKLSQGLTLRG